MVKPATGDGYDHRVTENCERVLVTLLRRLGPWKKSIYLVGGLTPRYLVQSRPPAVPPHAGTADVDIVVELQMLAETEAYQTLEENMRAMGLERAVNNKGQKVSWRWTTKTEGGISTILEFLADNPEASHGRVEPLPTKGNISALNIPHSSMVFDHFETKEITAELLGGNGMATETIRHANLVSFTCLKAFAYEDRQERKDAHDLVYCLEHIEGGLDEAVKLFNAARSGKDGATIDQALGVLAKRFVDDGKAEGYLKDGPVAVAKFETGDGDDEDARNARMLRQRKVSELISALLRDIAKELK